MTPRSFRRRPRGCRPYRRCGQFGAVLSILLSTTAAAAAQEKAPAPAAADLFRQVFGRERPALPSGAYPLVIDRVRMADVDVTFGQDGAFTLSWRTLRPTLEGTLAPDRLKALAGAAGEGAGLSPAQMAEAGITARFDHQAVAVILDIPAGLRELRGISLDRRMEPPAVTHGPAGLSGAVNLLGSAEYVWKGDTGSGNGSGRGWGERALLVDGFVNIDGVVLEGGGQVSSRRSGFRRTDIAATLDDPDKAVRYRVGDILPPTTGYQSSVPMLGVAAGRVFSMRPFDTFRPAGGREIELQTNARVEVFVNGRFLRDLRLAPGRYRLADIPLVPDGANQIELRITDEFGRVETVVFSSFASFDLLAEGVSAFGVAAGFVRSTGQDRRYGTDQPLLTGYYRQGVTPALTLGIDGQVSRRGWQVGQELQTSTPIGNIGLFGAVGADRDDQLGYAMRADYQQRIPALADGQLALSAEWFSRDFRRGGLGRDLVAGERLVPDLLPPDRMTLAASFAATIDDALSLQLGGSLVEDQAGETFHTAFGSASRTFGRVRATVGVQVEEGRRRSGTSLLFSLSMPLSDGIGARASYDTRGRVLRAGLDRPSGSSVDSWGWRAEGVRSRTGDALSGEVAHTANRFAATLRQDAANLGVGGGEAEEDIRTIAAAGTALVFADGAWGLSRPVGDGFAIIRPVPALRDAVVAVEPYRLTGEVETRSMARSDGLGAAVYPALSGYAPREMPIEVGNLPPGTSIDGARIVLGPRYRSGILVDLGNDANASIMGFLTTADGAPVANLGGRAERVVTEEKATTPEAADPADPVPFFTNASGRFFLEGLRAGHRYRLVLAGGRGVAELEIPADAFGLVRLNAPIIVATKADGG
ncbi:MAG: hypothetical protein RLY86_1326 [Pseudomonadota bacterium]|jgi:outer membrane usher protein